MPVLLPLSRSPLGFPYHGNDNRYQKGGQREGQSIHQVPEEPAWVTVGKAQGQGLRHQQAQPPFQRAPRLTRPILDEATAAATHESDSRCASGVQRRPPTAPFGVDRAVKHSVTLRADSHPRIRSRFPRATAGSSPWRPDGRGAAHLAARDRYAHRCIHAPSQVFRRARTIRDIYVARGANAYWVGSSGMRILVHAEHFDSMPCKVTRPWRGSGR